MKSRSIFKILSMFWVSSMIFTGCMSDVDLSNVSGDILVDESLVVPVGEANTNMQELLKKLDLKNLVTNDPNEIYFESLDSTSYSFRDVNLVANSANTVLSIAPSPSTVMVPANSAFPNPVTSSFDLGVNSDVTNERLDSVTVNSANITVKITPSNIVGLTPSNLRVTLIFPNNKVRISDGTTAGTNKVVINPPQFGTAFNVAISNFAMITSGGATTIPVQILLETKTSPVTVTALSRINVEMRFSSLNFNVAYGNFQPSLIASEVQHIPLDVATYLPDAYLKFVNPKATVDVQSNIGTKIRFRVDYIKAYVKADPTKEVKASFNGNDFYIYDLLKPAKPGDAVNTQMVFDKDNGATNKLFESIYKPDMLEYKFSTLVTPGTVSTDPLNPLFFPSYGKIKAKIKVQIPLYLNSGSNIKFQDTLYVTGGTIGSNVDNTAIDTCTLVFKVRNGLPVKAILSLFYLDATGAKINTTFDDNVYSINAPDINTDGTVKTASIADQVIKVGLNKAQFEDLKKAESVVYTIVGEGKDATSTIHFTKNDSFDVKLGVFVKMNSVKNLSNN